MIKRQLARKVTALTLQVCALPVSLLFANSALAKEEAPTQEIVEKNLKSQWDKSATSLKAKSVLTLKGVKFGKGYKATVQEVQVEGFPANARVTPAVVDFTVRTYYSNETQVVRRVREAWVFKDKMAEWTVMTGSVKGEDTTTKEAATK